MTRVERAADDPRTGGDALRPLCAPTAGFPTRSRPQVQVTATVAGYAVPATAIGDGGMATAVLGGPVGAASRAAGIAAGPAAAVGELLRLRRRAVQGGRDRGAEGT